MAYATVIQTGNFTAEDGAVYAATVSGEGYAGDPFTVECAQPAIRVTIGDRSDTNWTKIKDALITLNVVAAGADAPDIVAALRGIQGAGPAGYKLAVTRGGAALLSGYCLPTVTTTELNDRRTQLIQIQAKDRVKSLDEPWLNADGERYTGALAASVVIADILFATGLGLGQIKARILRRPARIGGVEDPLSVRIPTDPFYSLSRDGVLQAKSRRFVLEEVLKAFAGVQLIQWRGAWYVVQPSAHVSGNLVREYTYDADGVYQGPNLVAQYVSLDNAVWQPEPGAVAAAPAYRRAEVKHDYEAPTLKVTNGSFELYDDAGQVPSAWTAEGGTSAQTRTGEARTGSFAHAMEEARFSAPNATDAQKRAAARSGIKQVLGTVAAGDARIYDVTFFHNAFRSRQSHYTTITSGVAAGLVTSLPVSAVPYALPAGTYLNVLVETGVVIPQTILVRLSADVAADALTLPIVGAYLPEIPFGSRVTVRDVASVIDEIQGYYYVSLTGEADTYYLHYGGWVAASTLGGDFLQAMDEPSLVGPVWAPYRQQRIRLGYFPEAGTITLGIRQPSRYAGGSSDYYAIRIDDVDVREVSSSLAAKTYGVYDTDVRQGETHAETLILGDGPFPGAIGAMTYADGTQTDGWKGHPADAETYPHAQMVAREFMRAHRRAQQTIRISVKGPQALLAAASPVTAYELGGVRYWPAQFDLPLSRCEPVLDLVAIRDDGVPDGADAQETQDAAGLFGGEAANVYTDLSRRIQNALVNTAATVTAAVLPGRTPVTSIPIEPRDSIFPAKTEITIVDKRTGETFDLTVSANYPRNGATLTVEPYTFPFAIDEGSYVILNVAQALLRLSITEEALLVVARAGALCEVDADVDGEVSELTVTPLRRDVQQGDTLYIGAVRTGLGALEDDDDTRNDPNRRRQQIQVSEDTPEGSTTLPIAGTPYLTARAGDPIVEDGVEQSSKLLVRPDEIQLAVERREEGTAFTTTTATLIGGAVTSISVAAIPEAVKAGDYFDVVHLRTGAVKRVLLDAPASAGATSLSITSTDFGGTPGWPVGSRLRLSDRFMRASITVLEDEIDLRVTYNDVINAVNISDEGILIDASRLEINGDATFGPGYDPFHKNEIQYQDVAPTTRRDGSDLQAGDGWRDTNDGNRPYTWNGDAWEEDYTIIDGGYIEASSQITVGTGDNVAVLSGSDGTYRIWAGDATAGDAPFRVTQGGALTATNATLTGSLSVSSTVTAGSGDDVAVMSASDGTYRLWIGDATAADAPFRVTKAGALTATNITAQTSTGSKRVEIRSSDNEIEFFSGGSSVVRVGGSVSGSTPGLVVASGFILGSDTPIVSQESGSGLQASISSGAVVVSQTGTTFFSATVDNSGGVIFLDDVSSDPATTTNKLYAKGGNLYWNGVQIN